MPLALSLFSVTDESPTCEAGKIATLYLRKY